MPRFLFAEGEAVDPDRVQLFSQATHGGKFFTRLLAHFLRGLDAGREGLKPPGFAVPLSIPGVDHLRCHFDMTLHPKMESEYEHLVGTERVSQYARSARWCAEGFSVPLKHCGGTIAGDALPKPSLGFCVVFGPNRTPADFLDRVYCDLPP